MVYPSKSKLVPACTMKTYRIKCIAPLIPNLSTRRRWEVNFTLLPLLFRERTQVPIVQEVVWAPEPVWTCWRREKWFDPVGIWTPYRPGRTLVHIPSHAKPACSRARNERNEVCECGLDSFNPQTATRVKIWPQPLFFFFFDNFFGVSYNDTNLRDFVTTSVL